MNLKELLDKGFSIGYPVKVSKNDWFETYSLSKASKSLTVLSFPLGCEEAYVISPSFRRFTDVETAIDYFLTLSFHPTNLVNFIKWQRENGFNPEDCDNKEYENLLNRYFKEYTSEYQNSGAIQFIKVAKAQNELEEEEDEE
jgi:hypothetical protein